MIANLKEKFKTLFEKAKQIKHIQIYLAIGVALLAVCGYFLLSPKSKKKEDAAIDNNCTEFSSSAEYIDYLENKLENVITSLKGVGQAQVVITLEKGFEYIYQTEEEVRSTTNGTSITTTNVIMVDGKPVIKEEIYPIIKGVVVVAQGSDDIGVKLNILSLIQTVIEIDSSQINIMTGE